MTTKILIVDDSALMRQMLTKMLEIEPSFEVVGVANDPYQAREMIKQLHPDVITLDVEMPKMDGVTFLKNLMRLHPLPVVMVSSLTEKGAEITLQAMEFGAVDFVTKPKIDLATTFESYTDELIEKVKMAARVPVSHLERTFQRKLKEEFEQARREAEKAEKHKPTHSAQAMSPREKLDADAVIPKVQTKRHFSTTEKIIAIGSSTGGTEALKEIITRLPASTPAIVISQHIPAAFSGPFANRINGLSAMTVKEAEDGEQILPGHVYVAPGSHHLLVVRSGARYMVQLNDGPPVNRHKPSVDVMFRSVAQNVGNNALGIILTGMGDDGARGMVEMREVGIYTMAQDEATSVVWGMPGSSVRLGGVNEQVPLQNIAKKIIDWVKANT